MKKKIYVGIMFIFAGLAFSQHVLAHPSFNVGEALSALEKGDLETAEAELQKARFAMPDNPEIQYNLGVVSYRKRDYALAARQFAMAAADQAVSENRFNSLYNMGNATFRMGDYAAAVSAYESCLELKKDEQAEYNLKVAREKLQKQLEKQQASEKQQQQKQQPGQNQQSEPNQGDKSSEKSGGEQGQKNDPQNQEWKNQQGQNDQSGQNNASEKNDGGQSDDQQKNESGEKDTSAQSNDAEDGQKPDTGESDQSKQQDKGSSEHGGENASGTQQLTEQQGGSESEPREDVQMQPADSGTKDMPEASQRARALKNTKVNPYMIEKILKEMERREKEAQLYYRNEPRRSDEIDPFEMDAQQLREWMEKRRRPQAPAPSDGPDW